MRLAEVLVALLVGGLLLAGVWRSSASIRRDMGALSDRAGWTDARRVVGLLLDQEAGGFVADPGSPGELPVRAHRWWGVVCDTVPRFGRASVRAQGLRRPDPDKDSLLLIMPSGQVAVRQLEGVYPAQACGGEAVDVAWVPEPDEEFARVIRGFERGVYRLDGAFRYRRGRGGAQPLTAEVFDPDSIRLEVDSVAATLHLFGRPARRWSRGSR